MSQRFEFLLDVCGLAPAAAPGGRRGLILTSMSQCHSVLQSCL